MDKVKVGFIGAGGIANFHLSQLSRMEDVIITAVCDLVEEKAQETSRKFGGRVYADYYQMFEKEQLDAVYICVPPFAHKDQEVIACRKKIPFFVEKPVALSLDKAQEVEREVRDSGVITSVGYLLRYMDIVDRTKKILSGRPLALISGRYFGEIPPADWIIKKDRSGGQLVEQATHIVNLMVYFGGKVTEVYSQPFTGLIKKRLPEFDVEDASITLLKFETGAIGSIVCTWLGFGYYSSLELFSDGLEIRLDPITTMQVLTADQKEEYLVKNDYGFIENRNFIEAVKTGNKDLIRSDYYDGMKTLEITLAAGKSMETGQPVRLK